MCMSVSLCICLCICVPCVCRFCKRSEEAGDPLELQSQGFVREHVRVLETKPINPWHSEAVGTLDH